MKFGETSLHQQTKYSTKLVSASLTVLDVPDFLRIPEVLFYAKSGFSLSGTFSIVILPFGLCSIIICAQAPVYQK